MHNGVLSGRLPRRADQVGSLLRPQELKQARTDLAAGTIDAAELRAIEDRCIREVIEVAGEIWDNT